MEKRKLEGSERMSKCFNPHNTPERKQHCSEWLKDNMDSCMGCSYYFRGEVKA